LVSAQNRKRIYWTNIGMQPMGLFGYPESIIKQPKDKGILLKDILESEVDEKYFLSEKITNKIFKGLNINSKENTLRTSGHQSQSNKHNWDLIVHNIMPRSSTTGKGGTGPLSRTDGKTYCLDTGNTNAVEIREVQSGKGATIPARAREDGSGQNVVAINSRIRRLTPIECERLQTVADNYTAHVSDSQRYKMLGNGFTIDVIAHIFSYIK